MTAATDNGKLHLEITDTLSAADKAHLMEWRERVFPVEGKDYDWSPTTHHIVAYSGEEPVAHLGFGEFDIDHGGQSEQLIGVGGVVVRPEWQGNRIPQQLFERLHSTPVLEARSRVCSLFCPPRLESYYAHMGYQKFAGEVLISRDGTLEVFKLSFMVRGDARFGRTITLKTNPW